jgi:hypothetical protein
MTERQQTVCVGLLGASGALSQALQDYLIIRKEVEETIPGFQSAPMFLDTCAKLAYGAMAEEASMKTIIAANNIDMAKVLKDVDKDSEA